jgi:formiminoglutamase
MDSIINMPASFITPSGYSIEEARIYIRKTSSRLQTAYLHLPEGAPRRHTAEEISVGKTLAYLVADFMRVRDAKQPPAL